MRSFNAQQCKCRTKQTKSLSKKLFLFSLHKSVFVLLMPSQLIIWSQHQFISIPCMRHVLFQIITLQRVHFLLEQQMAPAEASSFVYVITTQFKIAPLANATRWRIDTCCQLPLWQRRSSLLSANTPHLYSNPWEMMVTLWSSCWWRTDECSMWILAKTQKHFESNVLLHMHSTLFQKELWFNHLEESFQDVFALLTPLYVQMVDVHQTTFRKPFLNPCSNYLSWIQTSFEGCKAWCKHKGSV